jgi:hypothetical protein
VTFNGFGDLRCGQDQTARSVQDQVERRVFVGEPNRLKNVFRVIYVNVADDRNSYHIDAFLAVNQDDHAASSFLFQGGDGLFAQTFNSPALKSRRHEKKQDQNRNKTSPGKDPPQNMF